MLSLLSLTGISPDPVAEQEAGIIGPGVPLPLRPASLSFSPSGHVDGILQYPPQEGGEAGSWQLSVPPIASPPMPLTPVVCPNDRLALVSREPSPEHVDALGEGSPRWPLAWEPQEVDPHPLTPPPKSDQTPGSGTGHSPALSLWQVSPETRPHSSAFRSVPRSPLRVTASGDWIDCPCC